MEIFSRKEFDEKRGLNNLISYYPKIGDEVYVKNIWTGEFLEVRVTGFCKDSVGCERIKYNTYDGVTYSDLKNVYKLKDYKVRNTPEYKSEEISFSHCSPQEQQRINNICNGYNINYGIIPGIRETD